MSKKVEVYTFDFCPFCDRAKNLLRMRGVIFSEHLVSREDDAQRERLFQLSKMKTFPQIFVEGKILGGYTELAAQDTRDQLKSLI